MILDWKDSDSEEEFVNNCKKYKDRHTEYWKANTFTYDLNDCGYRTPDKFASGSIANIYLGCSETEGIGTPLGWTWAYQLHNKLNDGTIFMNLAKAGTGIEAQFRELIMWKDKGIEFKNIFHFQPTYTDTREQWFLDDEVVNIVPHWFDTQNIFNVPRKTFIDVFSNQRWINRKVLTNILAIENLANRLGAKYFYHNQIPALYSFLQKKGGNIDKDDILARDRIHMTKKQHAILSDKMLEIYHNGKWDIDLLEGDIFNPKML
jgi:hypothetical protein